MGWAAALLPALLPAVLLSPLVEGSDTCWQGGQSQYKCQNYLNCGYSCSGSAETETCSVQNCDPSCQPCDQCARAFPGMYADPSGKCVSGSGTTPGPSPWAVPNMLGPLWNLVPQNLTAAIGMVLPPIQRAVGDYVKDKATEALKAMASDACFATGVAIDMHQGSYDYLSFWQMADFQGYTTTLGPMCAAALRLLLWHLLQPFMFYVSYTIYFPQLDGVEQLLFYTVAVREGLYVLVIVLTLLLGPVVFLWRHKDAANQRDEDAGTCSNNFVYIFAPEKFLLGHLFKKRSLKCRSAVVPVMYFFDACGTVAFIMLYMKHGSEWKSWLALFVSYGFAPLSLVIVTMDCLCGGTSQFTQAWSQTREVEMEQRYS